MLHPSADGLFLSAGKLNSFRRQKLAEFMGHIRDRRLLPFIVGLQHFLQKDCDDDGDDGDGGCLPCWIHTLPKLSLVSNVFSAVSSIFWNSKLHLFQTFSRLLLEKQPAAGAPASAPISCIGRISGCTAGHSASCISVAFHTFELHQELAGGWPALHWPNSSHLPLPGQLPSHMRNRIWGVWLNQIKEIHVIESEKNIQQCERNKCYCIREIHICWNQQWVARAALARPPHTCHWPVNYTPGVRLPTMGCSVLEIQKCNTWKKKTQFNIHNHKYEVIVRQEVNFASLGNPNFWKDLLGREFWLWQAGLKP